MRETTLLQRIIRLLGITALTILFFACQDWLQVQEQQEKAKVAGEDSTPLLTGTVSIGGKAYVGQSLTVNTDSLGGKGTISYRWKRETADIGTNSAYYQLTITDIGSSITVTVTRSGNSGSVTSDPFVFIPRTYAESVKKVEFTESTATVSFDNLFNNDIYLVKVNKSGYKVTAANTGSVQNITPSPGFMGMSGQALPQFYEELPRMGHPDAEAFNANPPPIVDEGPRRSRAGFIPPVVGDTRMFWVESYYGSGTYVQKQATLRATGQYENIWIMDENYGSGRGNKLNTAQAQALADKFDLIYSAETNLLGFEYGGGPGGDGGKDGDPKIQILVYDILDDSGEGAGVGGFFWSKDFYSQSQIDSYKWKYKTNLAEMFYIHASGVIENPDYYYSVLIHEFQHMINFNVKYVKNGKSSASWYDEMLSMITEDVIAPLIGIDQTNSGHPIKSRIRTFLSSYNEVGVTEWDTLKSESYAKGYAFGAYLMRNYGGPELLKKILANNTTNIESITAALEEISPGMTFEKALSRYGEAMIYSGSFMPESVVSFDKTVTSTVNGTSYTAYGFDIWNMVRGRRERGPLIFPLTPMDMKSRSILLQSDNAWTGRSGNISIILEKPTDPDVELFLMVR